MSAADILAAGWVLGAVAVAAELFFVWRCMDRLELQQRRLLELQRMHLDLLHGPGSVRTRLLEGLAELAGETRV